MTSIEPNYYTLDQLLEGRLFRIPEYQRTYSWHRKQRQDLFEDIKRIRTREVERPHFMATMVGLCRGNRIIMTKEYHVVEVVDGQQRITTLILLLKAIAKAIDRSSPSGKKIGKDIDEILVKQDEASLLLLQTNHDSSHCFAEYLREGTHASSKSARTIADRELLSAMEDCEAFVDEWQRNGGTHEELTGLLRNRLTFVFHQIDDEALVYTVFEVLNSRGLDVSWFDRLKSMLMAIVFEAKTESKNEFIEEVHRLWTDIYGCVGLRLGLNTESLRFAATLWSPNCPSKPLSEELAAQLLRDLSKAGPAKVIETTRWLKAVTEVADRLAADRRRNAVTRILQARMLATAVYLRPDFTADQRNEILRRWENVTFRIYGMLRRDSRTSVGAYVRLAWSIVKENLPAAKVLDRLSDIGARFPAEKAVRKMEGADCYEGWKEELRYLLFRYEEHLARKAGLIFSNEQWNRIWEASAVSSIEHIWPQSTGDSRWVHRLGNLLVLSPGLDSSLGAKAPREKADAYQKTGLLIAQEVVSELDGWGIEAIEKREKRLLEWAQKEWTE